MTLFEKLEEAENAYHALQCGRSAVEVRDQNGESVRYTAANAGRLYVYITDLKQQINGATDVVSGPMRPFLS
jgi:hypothetical protein